MGKQIQLVFVSISPKSFFEDYSNQDDGPVLHKDPPWSNGNAARAHRSRDRGLSLRHGLDHHSHHHLHHYAPLCKYHDSQKLRPRDISQRWSGIQTRLDHLHLILSFDVFYSNLELILGFRLQLEQYLLKLTDLRGLSTSQNNRQAWNVSFELILTHWLYRIKALSI